MRCRTCDYPLWNLPARKCPECGAPFRPSEYEFKVGFVRFGCPRCGQGYYGTDAKGHLEPRDFDCVSCGVHLEMDGMVLAPSEGVGEEETRLRDPLPWLARAKIGFVRGWLRTVFGGIGGPSGLARALPPESHAGQAWWFAAITLGVCAAGALVPFLVLMMVSGGVSLTRMATDMAPALGVVMGLRAVWLVVWGASAHLLLRLLGVRGARLGRTYECVCYTCGPSLIMLVPCVNLYFFWIGDLWWSISAAAMLTGVYRVRAWKAAAAALALPALVAAGVVLVIVVAFTRMNSAVAAVGATPPPGTAGAQSIVAAMGRAGTLGGSGAPVHAAALVGAGGLGAAELISPGSSSDPTTVLIQGTTLEDFLGLDPAEQQRLASAASAALPAGVVAHRLGDVVFTYHGVNSADPAHAGLWVFVIWPDPAANAGEPGYAVIGMANGATTQFAAGTVGTLLPIQNAQRQAAGLAPLPHPRDVLQEAPATGP